MNQPEELNQSQEPRQPDNSLLELEQYLTRELRPVDAPSSLADRVMALAQSAAPAREKVVRIPIRRRIWTVWTMGTSGAIAAALLAGFFVAGQIQARHQRQKAELAEHQFEVALRITGETLEQTRQQLLQAGIDLGK